MAYYLDFILLQYIYLTFGFAFSFSKVYHKISVLLKWIKILKFWTWQWQKLKKSIAHIPIVFEICFLVDCTIKPGNSY